MSTLKSYWKSTICYYDSGYVTVIITALNVSRFFSPALTFSVWSCMVNFLLWRNDFHSVVCNVRTVTLTMIFTALARDEVPYCVIEIFKALKRDVEFLTKATDLRSHKINAGWQCFFVKAASDLLQQFVQPKVGASLLVPLLKAWHTL